MTRRLTVAIGVSKPVWFVDLVRELEPRIDLHYDQSWYARDRGPQQQPLVGRPRLETSAD